jgi:2-iminobutanoate/2-iminopropanoate deaminase
MSDQTIRLVTPLPTLPLSLATVAGGLVFVSGQVGFKPGTAELVSDDVADQCRQTFANIDKILEDAGSGRDRIVRCGVFLVELERDYAAMNQCYADWLGDHRPARTTIGCRLARPDILVEVDCVAVAGDGA